MASLSMVACSAIAPAGVPPPGAEVNGAATGGAFLTASPEDLIQCRRCGYPGCDVRVTGCGCSLHSRCIPFPPSPPIAHCPHCGRTADGLVLFAMSFREIDEARRSALACPNGGKRSRKRKDPSSGSRPEDGLDHDKFDDPADLRTGRWTTEEMTYTDELIAKFKSGQLPLVDGIKLNDFLANMLKSKQSRLTKKMKNANLSSKSFKRTTGYVANPHEAQEFARLEDAFFRSIHSPRERAEIRFHVQKEWRELFSSFCVSVGQPLDADAWLGSVEEMDRRAAAAKEAARVARRKLMMGYALSQDIQNPDSGVFIERSSSGQMGSRDATSSPSSVAAEKAGAGKKAGNGGNNARTKSNYQHASPFLSKVLSYLQRYAVPFEYVDAWVPSFVPGDGGGVGGNSDSKCRLCFAGFATADVFVGSSSAGQSLQPLSAESQYNLVAFGEYSQKFSFNVGCGLPGRVYQSGVPTWEQSVQNAPHHHFERCGGAMQWGVKTVVGLPIPSPNVGRIVLVLYSREDRIKDQELVGKLCEEFTRFMPTPKWKLVVDLGKPSPPTAPTEQAASSSTTTTAPGQSTSATASQAAPASAAATASETKDNRIDELISLLGEHMPSDPSSPFSSYLQGFMSLRLMLLRSTRSKEEDDIVQTLLSSYSSYSMAGRAKGDIAAMLARDFLFLQQHQPQQQPQQQQQQQQQHGQPQAPVPAPAHTNPTLGQPQWQQGGSVPATGMAGQNSSSWHPYQQGMPPT